MQRKDTELKKCCSGLKINAQKLELIKKSSFVLLQYSCWLGLFNLQTGQSKYKCRYTLECLHNSMPVNYGVSHGLVLTSLPFIICITHFPKLKKDKAFIHTDDTSIPNIRINSKESETHIYMPIQDNNTLNQTIYTLELLFFFLLFHRPVF
jgi:hypothetical protein